MKKVLSFCVLCVFLVMMCVGVKAQTPGCCMTITPANLPTPIVANQPDTIYFQPDLSCLSGDTKISLEWVVKRNGVQIPDGMLSTYFNDFRFQTLGRVNGVEAWIGESYTSAYCNNGNGYGSYPGANTPIAEEGIPCAFEGPFAIQSPGQQSFYDYFYVRFFGDTNVTNHRLIINPKDDAEYEITMSIYTRVGGSDWDHSVGNAEHANTYIGGHMSQLGSLVFTEVLDQTDYIQAPDQVICFGDTLWLGNPLTPYYTIGNDTAYYYSPSYTGGTSCHADLDSVVTFRLDVITLDAPVLNVAASTLQICDGGAVTLTAIPSVAADPTTCIWTDAANTPLDTTDVYTTSLTATTTYNIYSYEATHNCVSPTSTPVVVEVYVSPAPYILASSIDTVCENQDVKLYLDQDYSAASVQWYHNGAIMAGETSDSVIINNAQLSDAGEYKAEVAVDHTHSIYTSLTITCTSETSDSVVINARPELSIVDFNGTTMDVLDTTIADFVCPIGFDSITVAVNNGAAPYVYTWTNAPVQIDAAASSTAVVTNGICDTTYSLAMTATDAYGCVAKQDVQIKFTVNDTTAPVVTVNVPEVAADTTGVDCKYLIPDVLAGITATDNCIIKSIAQTPAAGDTIVATTTVMVTVIDSCGNVTVDSVKVTITPMTVEAPVDSIVDVLCPNLDPNTGSFVVNVADGTPNYTLTLFDLTNGVVVGSPIAGVEDSYKFENLAAADYRVYVVDANGCNDSVDATITAPSELKFKTPAPSTVDASCSSIADGKVIFGVEGGVTPYTVTITSTSYTNTIVANAIDTTIDGLEAGEYIINVVDSNNCTIADTVTINQPVVLNVDTLITRNPICHDDTTGYALITVSGGTLPYTYVWTKDSLAGDTVCIVAATDTNLTSGTYFIHVEDANGCDLTRSFTLANPDAMSFHSIAPSTLTCPYETDYEFMAVMDEMQPVITYTWIMGTDTLRVETSTLNNDTLHFVPAVPSCNATYTLNLIVSDTNMCSIDTTIDFSIVDTIAPTHTGELDTIEILACSVTSAPAELATIADFEAENVEFTDNCTAPADLTITCTADTTTVTCPFIIKRTYKVTDKCGNEDVLVQVVSISDTVKPMVVYGTDTIRDGGTVGDSVVYADIICNPNLPVSRDYTVAEVIANHVGDISEFLSCTVNPSTSVRYNVTTTIIDATDTVRGIVYGATLTVADLCGNVSVFNAPVIVKDTIKPVVTNFIDSVYYDFTTATGCSDNVPAPFTTVGEVNAHTPNAISDCNININTPVTITLADTTYNCPDSIVRTYSVTDAAGNTSTFTHTFVILDTVAPILSMDTIVDTLYETSACAADAAELSALVSNFSDVPAISAAYPDFTAGDCTDLTVSPAGAIDTLIDTIPAMTLTYTYDVKDECGNTSSIKHIVRIFDTIAPVVNSVIPTDTVYSTTTDCSPAIAAIADLAALEAYMTSKGATLDITECHLDSATLSYVRTDSILTNPCELIYNFIYTVADSANNVSAEFAHSHHVFDTLAPVFAGATLPDSTLYLTADCLYNIIPASTVADLDTIFGSVFVTEECHLDSLITFVDDTVPGLGSLKQKTIINRTYTISDICGNADSVTQVIYVLDTVKPVLMTTVPVDTLPTDTIYTTSTSCLAAPAVLATVAALPTGYSIYDCSVPTTTALTLTNADTTGTCPEVITRTYTVTDTCTNTSAPFTHTIVFLDTLAPVVAVADYLDTLLAYTNGVAGCDFTAPVPSADLASLVAANAHFNNPTDCHTVTLTSSVDHDTIHTGCDVYYFTRTYTLTDECGNYTEVDQIINVSDTNAPIAGLGLLTDTVATPLLVDCKFVAPDLEARMKPLYTDNCAANADLLYFQSPAAGDTLTADTVIKVWVVDACIVGVDTNYWNVSDTALVNVTLPALPIVDSIAVDSVLCAGGNTGAFLVVLVGDESYSMTYQYNPNPNSRTGATIVSAVDTFNVASLYAGHIEFTVTDKYGCKVDSSLDINEPDTLKNVLSFFATADCSSDDMIVIDTLLGGVAPFTYEWKVSEGPTEVSASPVVGPVATPDTLTYTTPSDNNVHTFTYSVVATDANGCTASADTVYVTHPTYHFSDTGRVCYASLPYDWMSQGIYHRTITNADIPTDETTYIFNDTLASAAGCDSILTLRLEVTSNPYLVGRVASTSAAIDGSDLVENLVEYTTSTDTTSQFELFVKKNCTTNCNLKVSLEVDMYYVDANGVEILMPNVTDYADVSFASYMDMYYTQWTPANTSTLSLPGHYVSFNGFAQRFNYFNLCFVDPEYACNPTPTAASQTALPFYGPNYDGAGAPNLGRVHGIKVASWRQPGDYKFVVRLARRDDATAYALTARDWCTAIQVGGHSAALTTTVYDTITFFVHVVAGTSPIPAVDPFESEITYSDPESVEEAEVTVYPNPARDQVNVELTGFEGQTVIIVANSEGRVMNNISIDVDALSNNVLTINTADFAQGVYSITARCSNAIVTRRVVIIR